MLFPFQDLMNSRLVEEITSVLKVIWSFFVGKWIGKSYFMKKVLSEMEYV